MDASSTATAIVHRLESCLQSVFDSRRGGQASSSPTPAPTFIWRDDAAYAGALQAYRQSSLALADVVTKFSIVIKTDPEDQVLESILEELDISISAIVPAYEELAKVDSLGAPLRKFVADSMSGLLYQLLEYLRHAKDRRFQNVNVSTGMIWKAIDDAKNLPAGNKMAYKRFVLSKVGVVKDTIREFQELLDQGGAVLKPEESPADPEDQASADDEERYTDEEKVAVSRALALMAVGAQYLKILSNLMVSVADRLHACNDSATLSTVFSSALSLVAGGGSSVGDSSSGAEVCRQWVLALSEHCRLLEDVCIDLGSELYSPVDESAANEYYLKMHSELGAVNATLEAYSTLLSAEESVQRQLLLSSFTGLPAALASEGGGCSPGGESDL